MARLPARPLPRRWEKYRGDAALAQRLAELSQIVRGVSMSVPWSLKRATALPSGRLVVEFVDGLVGVVTLSEQELTAVLAGLREDQYFVQMRVVDGVPTWPDGEDLAPDRLYQDARTADAA